MASDSEIDLVAAVVAWLKGERPDGLPDEVMRSDNELVPLKILGEHDVDPEKRPYLVFIADGSQRLHPRLVRYQLRLENNYRVDDFSVATIQLWQMAVVDSFEDRGAAITKINTQLEIQGSRWRVRNLVAGSGDAEEDGARTRGITDSWSVTLQRVG